MVKQRKGKTREIIRRGVWNAGIHNTGKMQESHKITAITPIVVSYAVFVLSPNCFLSHTVTHMVACTLDFSKKMDGEWRFRFLYFVKQREPFLRNRKEHSCIPNDV